MDDYFSYEDWAKTTAPNYEMTSEQIADLEALYAPVTDFLLANNIPGSFSYVARQHPSGDNLLLGTSTAVGIEYYTAEMLALYIMNNGGLPNFDAHYDTLLEAHNERVRKNAPRIVTSR